MDKAKRTAVMLVLAVLVLTSAGFGSKKCKSTSRADETGATHRVNLIKSGSAQQKAAAAFWLSQQSPLDASIIDSMVGLLGDKTLVDSSQYRYIVDEHKSTLGEEVALALVRIGSPSIPPLIRVLKTSPEPEARKNAARALGALHQNGVTDPNAA